MKKQKVIGLLVLALLLVFTSPVLGQRLKHFMKLGEKAVEDGDYLGAAFYYGKAIELDSNKLKPFYQRAQAYRQYNEYQLAKADYLYVVELDRKRQFKHAQFWLANMEMQTGQYKSAYKNFKRYRKNLDKKNHPNYKIARKLAASCEFAQNYEGDTANVDFKPLPGKVNSFDSEYAPVLLDDTILFFSSMRFDSVGPQNTIEENRSFNRIYQSTLKDNAWGKPVELDTVINNPRTHAGNGAFSPDSTRFYFTRCPSNMKCAIYETRYSNGKWAKAKKLTAAINRDGFSTTQPHVAMVDGQEILFYVTDRPGGKGGMDIWYIPFTDGAEKVRSRNLGSRINSPGDELCPYYDTLTQTLYFSSSWHNGFGGFDVFEARGQNPRRLTKPVNLGRPFNTPANELYFSYNKSVNRGFLTSNRPGAQVRKGETCCNDIYTFEYPEEQTDTIDTVAPPVVTIKELQDYLPITLYFHNDRPNPKSIDTTTTLTYVDTYREYLRLEDEYINALSVGAQNEKDSLKVEDEVLAFFSDFVDDGADKLDLVAENLIRELEKGSTVELAVKGYASPLAKSDYNLKLTLRRIQSLVNYLNAYEGGIYHPYLDGSAPNGGRLLIKKVPFGENKASTKVSDKRDDKRNSIYSQGAALERRIEILAISIKPKDTEEDTGESSGQVEEK